MSNKWEYATLGQTDRLKLIQGGNERVYNAEKRNNQTLRTERAKLGLSTSEIDDWDGIIDSAHKSAKASTFDRSVLPKFLGTKESAVTNALNSYLKALNAEADEDKENAINDAVMAANYITEWLVNNGYSVEGATAQKQLSDIKNSLHSVLKGINGKVNSSTSSAVQAYKKLL